MRQCGRLTFGRDCHLSKLSGRWISIGAGSRHLRLFGGSSDAGRSGRRNVVIAQFAAQVFSKKVIFSHSDDKPDVCFIPPRILELSTKLFEVIKFLIFAGLKYLLSFELTI